MVSSLVHTYLNADIANLGQTIFSSFSCISEDFYGWNRVFKEVDLINRISVPLTSELNGSPSERKYLWERGHWEKMRSGKGPSWLIIKSKWLSSICSWLLLRIGNNAHPVRSSWKRERECVCGGGEWECILSSQSSKYRCFGLEEPQKLVLGRGDCEKWLDSLISRRIKR